MHALLLMLALGCAGVGVGGPDPDALLAASKQATLETAHQLGPHRTVVEVTSTLPGGRETTEALEIAWGDWENFKVVRTRDGAVRSETRVIDGNSWNQTGAKGAWAHDIDAELARVELGQTWSRWADALKPFDAAMVVTHEGNAQVEGRPAETYAVTMGPVGEPKRRQHVPLELAGRLVLDAGTSIRLSVEADGRYAYRGKEDDVRAVKVRVRRSDFGAIPELSRP